MNYKLIAILAIIIASIVGYPLSMTENVSVALAQEEDRNVEEEDQQREEEEAEEAEVEEEKEESNTSEDEEEDPTTEEVNQQANDQEEEETEEGETETEGEEENSAEEALLAEDSKQLAASLQNEGQEEEEEPYVNEEATTADAADQSRLSDASTGSKYEPGYIGTEGQIGDFIDSVRSSPSDEQSVDVAEQDLTESLEIAAAERTAQSTSEEGVTLAEAITEIYNRARGELLKITGKLADAGKINVPPSLQRAFTFVRETNPIISRISSSQKIVDVADALNEARAQLERLSVPTLPVPPSTTCPPGQTGTPPNCTPTTEPPPTQCPPGQTGTPPNCTPTERPPVGSTGGTFRDPNNPEEGCSTLLSTERGAQLHDHCLRDDVSRCSLVDPFDNSACDTFIIHPHRNAPNDAELAGGNEYSVACIPGHEPVIIGYETEFVTEPVPIVDCQPVS